MPIEKVGPSHGGKAANLGWLVKSCRTGTGWGIVAETGGLLSHSAIVAREFGIPFVVSVAGAMRIPDGWTVRVDGYTGPIQWEAVLLRLQLRLDTDDERKERR